MKFNINDTVITINLFNFTLREQRVLTGMEGKIVGYVDPYYKVRFPEDVTGMGSIVKNDFLFLPEELERV